MSLVDIIKHSENAFTFAPMSQDCIHQAEKELNVTFSKEYVDYLAQFGVSIFGGHELTGLCDGKRLDVVRITQEQKKLNHYVPDDWYVVECLDIDNIVVWQDPDGAIYETFSNAKARKVANSLVEYINRSSY